MKKEIVNVRILEADDGARDCPFCGSDELGIAFFIDGYTVGCGSCCAAGPRAELECDAISEWNVASRGEACD